MMIITILKNPIEILPSNNYYALIIKDADGMYHYWTDDGQYDGWSCDVNGDVPSCRQ